MTPLRKLQSHWITQPQITDHRSAESEGCSSCMCSWFFSLEAVSHCDIFFHYLCALNCDSMHLKIKYQRDYDEYISLCVSDGSLLYANPGHSVTLPCFYSSASQLCWYKQVAGEEPQIVVSSYRSAGNIFYNQFKDDKRFSVHTGEGFYHLNISSVRESDSAMYFCGRIGFPVTEFDHGIFLVLNGRFL